MPLFIVLQERGIHAFNYCATRTPCSCLYLLCYENAASMPLTTVPQGHHAHGIVL